MVHRRLVQHQIQCSFVHVLIGQASIHLSSRSILNQVQPSTSNVHLSFWHGCRWRTCYRSVNGIDVGIRCSWLLLVDRLSITVDLYHHGRSDHCRASRASRICLPADLDRTGDLYQRRPSKRIVGVVEG